MSQNDFLDQMKKMDKKERRDLLEKLTAALTPEQQKQVQSIMGDKKQMEKIKNNLKGDDFSTLVEGLAGKEDAQDFLNSPQVQNRLKELLQ
ncbi:MAG: hypothetical protein IJO92_04990 [Clostridia bacterium]|nr:hypothetical protein [Clostridia bacterium]